MSTTKTRDDIVTILETTKPRPPQKCHTIDHRGYAICGAFGPSGDSSGKHSMRECKARGHRHCVICTELGRQLGPDAIVA